MLSMWRLVQHPPPAPVFSTSTVFIPSCDSRGPSASLRISAGGSDAAKTPQVQLPPPPPFFSTSRSVARDPYPLDKVSAQEEEETLRLRMAALEQSHEMFLNQAIDSLLSFSEPTLIKLASGFEAITQVRAQNP